MDSVFILIGLLLAQDAQTQSAAAQAQTPYVERIQKEFAFFPGGKIEITAAVPGNLTVVGWERGSTMIEAERVVFNLAADRAKALSDQYPIHIRYNQTSATIRTSGPPLSAATMEVNITAYVPKSKTDVVAKMLMGDFAVRSINGWIEATLSEGSIEAKGISGYFSGTTRKGDVLVDMSGKRWSGHSFTAVTRQGRIDLMMPLDYSAALQLETRNGEIVIQYPQQLVEGELVPLQATVRKSARSVKAAVGDGGSPINLQTYTGDMRLASKSTP